jgi:hypothetical protein
MPDEMPKENSQEMAASQGVETAKHQLVQGKLTRIDQWSPGVKLSWSPPQIQHALYQHHRGKFAQAAKLATAMLQDDEIPQDLSVSTNLIVGADFRLQPTTDDNGEEDKQSAAIADEFQETFCLVHPPIEMAKMFDWYELTGIAVGVYDWTRVKGKWEAKFRALNPEYLEFEDSLVDPQTGLHGAFRYRSRHSYEIVTPGDGRWVLWSEGRESWIQCAVRALGFDWYGKQQTFRDLMRYTERHGLPIVTIKVPSFSAPETAGMVLKDAKALGTDTTMTLPSHMMPESGHEVGFELDLVEAKDQAYEVFFRALDRFDRKTKMYFLGTNVSELEGTAGSRATSGEGRNLAMQKAQERYNKVRSFVQQQMLKPIIEIMRGPVDDAILPMPIYLIEGDADLKERAETTEAFGKALTAIGLAGYKVTNVEEEARQYGLELEEKEIPAALDPDNVQGDGLSNSNGQEGKPPESGSQDADDGDDDDGDDEEQEKLDALTDEPDGFVNGATYIEGLTQASAREAEALEALDTMAMVKLIEESKTPQELQEKIAARLNDQDPVLLAAVFAKADLLSQLAGLAAVEEDL